MSAHDIRWFEQYAENESCLKPLTDSEWTELEILLIESRTKLTRYEKALREIAKLRSIPFNFRAIATTALGEDK